MTTLRIGPDASAPPRTEPAPAADPAQRPSDGAGRSDGPSVGTSVRRIDGPLKVTGTAPYAYEQPTDEPLYLWPLTATIPRGRITAIDSTEAMETPGVVEVLTHLNAPRLRIKADPGLWMLQNDAVHYRNQIIGGVLATTPEAAREAAEQVDVEYAEEPAKLTFDPHDPDSERVRIVMMKPGTETKGDVSEGMARATFAVDHEYAHPSHFHAQMEPHSVIATWHDVGRDPRMVRLSLFESNQGPLLPVAVLAPLLGLLPHQIEIVAPYVGGGFGGKAFPHPHVVLAALAAKMASPRPVKLALTRQQMFSSVGHRAASVQHVRLGADADGRLLAIEQVSTQETSRLKQSTDQSVLATRMMYATPNRHTEHRIVKLDVPPATWMRAPGDFTGMWALESAMDELAHASGIDPIELRLRNEPDVDPESGKPWSSRALVECLERGSERFGWSQRTAPGQRREGEWLVGLGMASTCFPNTHIASLFARVTFTGGRYVVRLQASDIGTGAHTILSQIAADALGVTIDLVETDIGRTGTPMAMIAGGSAGTYEWGNAIVAACERFRRKYGDDPEDGATVRAQGRPPRGARKYSRHAFGAQFAEVAVSTVTAETRVRRMLGVYAAGTIINPLTARSQMIGGMTMAMSAALHEDSYRDPRYGHIANHDLAGYHIASHLDIPDIEVEFLPEHDKWYGAKGSKGIGEMAMVGTPAAIANAVFNATGQRLREMPFSAARLLAE